MNDQWSDSGYHHKDNNNLNSFSPKVISKLRSFYMLQSELSRELLEAQPLGICKTIGLTAKVVGTTKSIRRDSKEISS